MSAPTDNPQAAAEVALALRQPAPVDAVLALLACYQSAGMLPPPGPRYAERLRGATMPVALVTPSRRPSTARRG